jgi:RNA polymerase sigma factor (sigma-70 family)
MLTSHVLSAARTDSAHHVDIAVAAGLVRSAQAGDSAALNELIRLCSPLVRSRALQVVGSRGDPDDVAQEVFERLVRNLHTVREPERVIAWLIVVTRRTAIEMSRKTAGSVPQADLGEIAADIDSPEDEALYRCGRTKARDSVRLALAQLDDDDRRLIELLHRDDRPQYAVVSEIVGRPVGSLGPTRARVLHRLGRSPHLHGLAWSA